MKVLVILAEAVDDCDPAALRREQLDDYHEVGQIVREMKTGQRTEKDISDRNSPQIS